MAVDFVFLSQLQEEANLAMESSGPGKQVPA